MLFRRLSAASQSFFSKPRFAPLTWLFVASFFCHDDIVPRTSVFHRGKYRDLIQPERVANASRSYQRGGVANVTCYYYASLRRFPCLRQRVAWVFHNMVELVDVTGTRGEAIAELALTEYNNLNRPLFKPGFLGDKWPAIDFYVELNSVRRSRPYFFAQTKSTRSPLTANSLTISTKKKDIERLLRLPGPTYILGVHEPTMRTFVRSVHSGLPVKAITRIPLAYELNSRNLRVLYEEVKQFWKSSAHKPKASVFS